MPLRDYQVEGDQRVREALRAGKRRILVVGSTGSGKGTWLADLIRRADSHGKRVIFTVPRKEIVLDMSGRLDELGLEHGVIMGDHERTNADLPIQVASIDTLHRRDRAPADILIFDEAHTLMSPKSIKVLERYPDAILIGTTATPILLSGRGLGEVYEVMIEWPSMAELITRGYLVPSEIWAPSAPDLSRVHTLGGEFNQEELSAACDKPQLVGDIVDHWRRLAGNKRTVVFAVDLKNARNIQGAFRESGFDFWYVDGTTDAETRKRTWAAIRAHDIPGVVNVGVISLGFDCPPISVLVDAQPTASLARQLQKVGRVLRTYPGKVVSKILDHAGNSIRHGFPDAPHAWTLDGIQRKPKNEESALSILRCSACFRVYKAAPNCPYCGLVAAVKERKLKQVAGELQKLDRETAALNKLKVVENNSRFREFLDLKYTQLLKGYKPGWPTVVFRAKFGYFPPKEWQDAAEASIKESAT